MMSPGTLWDWDWTGDQKCAEGVIYKVWLLIMKASQFGYVVKSALLCHHPLAASTVLVLCKLTLLFCLRPSCVSLISHRISFAAVENFLCCSCTSSSSHFSSPCLGQWVNVSLINHFIPCQSFGLTERYRRDRHCFKKWSSAHDAAGNMNKMKCYRNE